MSTMELLQPVANAFRDRIDLRGNWFFAFDKSKDKTYETGVARQMSVPVPAALQDLFVSPEERNYCGTMWYEPIYIFRNDGSVRMFFCVLTASAIVRLCMSTAWRRAAMKGRLCRRLLT